MIWLSRILTFLIGFGALWGVVFLIITTYGWEKVWASIHGPSDLGAVEFEGLAKTSKPNQALICPEDLCADGAQDRTSPQYSTDVGGLRTALLKSLEQETSLERVDDGTDPMRLRYIQRTRLLRFPDTIRIQFYPMEGGGGSTLALYSQSQIGTSDLGINLARANRWLARLKDLEKTPE
ncbi:MAG: DUF1499 domain-containing protein [Rhizobiaceae bacterium]